MKIKNLYIGSVCRVVNAEYYYDEEYDINCKTTLLRDRFTLCLVKDLECGNPKAKDIIFGGVYSLKPKREIGDMYINHLYSLEPVLFDAGYTKSNISKGKVKTLFLGELLDTIQKYNIK